MKRIFTTLLAAAFLAANGPVLALGGKEQAKQADAKKVMDKKAAEEKKLADEKKAAEDKAAAEKKAADEAKAAEEAKTAAAPTKKKKKAGC